LIAWQTGSGTQTRVNMIEVLANPASLGMGKPLGQNWLVHDSETSTSAP